ncbi:DUF1793-domain-containing protein [Aspergillus ambiguus]|uniref:DUF1793-domain-containing protein n=1 Tax=Aspergillus ambiguus TaxID=176160 RepID=UPI003CCD4EF3
MVGSMGLYPYTSDERCLVLASPSPAYPLAVRTPYLSGRSHADHPPFVVLQAGHSSQFWSGNNLTWSVIARVDGRVYNLFGVNNALNGTEAAVVTSGSFTSTHTTFTVTVSAGFHQVQIYSDIDSSWTGQAVNSTWAFSSSDSTSVFRLSAATQTVFGQNAAEQALWGETVYATRPHPFGKVSSSAGASATLRSQFMQHGVLDGSRADWPSFGAVGFTHDLGEASVTFAIGHVREEVIDYLGKPQTGYYRLHYSDPVEAVSEFLDDYAAAAEESARMDALVQAGGESAYGANYSDILALSLRQIYGGMELVVPQVAKRPENAQAFIKEISSNGNINTVDVIYATFPALYVLSPDYIRLLLKPVFDYMASDAYVQPYAVHDLGANYPNATGHDPKGEEMPIEESGNVIILTYAYEAASGKTDLSTEYASLLQRYAQYLQTHGKYPENQLSLNDALGEMANQTNLAMKAACALSLYGQMTGEAAYARDGRAIAQALYEDRLGTAPNGSYFTMQYGNATWFLAYNHYADVLFDLDLFPGEAYARTGSFYPTVRKPAGVALTGGVDWGQTNWQSYVAATVSGDARKLLMDDMHAYISNGLNQAPFPDRYWQSITGR